MFFAAVPAVVCGEGGLRAGRGGGWGVLCSVFLYVIARFKKRFEINSCCLLLRDFRAFSATQSALELN